MRPPTANDGSGIVREIVEVAAVADPRSGGGNIDKTLVKATTRMEIAEGKCRFIR